MNIVRQVLSKNDLVEKLYLQLQKIDAFCALYDKGQSHYAEDIAVKLRVLFHHQNSSHSLLKQLKLEHILFADSASKFEPANLLTHIGLVYLLDRRDLTNNTFAPLLGEKYSMKPFSNWWSGKKVIVDKDKKSYTRKDLVLAVAETDGGAHSDPGIPIDYFNLTRNNSTNWILNQSDGTKIPFDNPVPPSIRQIAYETLETFSKIDIEKESKLR